MAYARDALKTTYATTTDMKSAEFQRVLYALNDLYNNMAWYDGTEFRLHVDALDAKTHLMEAIDTMHTDLGALKYNSET